MLEARLQGASRIAGRDEGLRLRRGGGEDVGGPEEKLIPPEFLRVLGTVVSAARQMVLGALALAPR